MKALWVIGVCLIAASPAWAAEQPRPRLVTGSVALLPSAAATRGELFATGGFSLGSVVAPVAHADTTATGAYAAYTFDTLRLSSSLKGDGAASMADLTAAYSGALMGLDGTAALSLGYEWARPSAFSLNPVHNPLMGDFARSANDLSLSLSFTHAVNPSLSLGGFAAATRTEEDQAATAGFRLGAGLGWRF